jgi:CxC5 like cysteine cluster associated with KDZ transposases
MIADLFIPIASSRSLYPPQHHCLNTDCDRRRRGLTLKRTDPRQAVLYTLGEGVLPVWDVPLYCEGECIAFLCKLLMFCLFRVPYNISP